ncbi:MAG: UDP-N-acetylmuramate dehydrogenase [Fimbriimonadaceae bacterium]|nr:UDP-N-acetylmuramate dehydrogenase [Fimbriimonadaceae bacterium]
MTISLDPARIERNRSLRSLTTLRAGGPAERFFAATNLDDLAEAALLAQSLDWRTTVLGSGSNVLPSDQGVPWFVVLNQASRIDVRRDGEVVAECGCLFQELFIKTAQAGLGGLEFAVGIPGTLGGALVSNAGAYRSNVSEFLTALEIVHQGERMWVDPEFMEFSYRDSILRRDDPPAVALLRVRLLMPVRDRKSIFDEAREYQRQRISKQPPQASAGSFFKNVTDRRFAESLAELPEKLKEAGVVPAGFLIERAGLPGLRVGGAAVARKHANFIVNTGRATATDIRQLAGLVKRRVAQTFEVDLEEEVLYLGDWSGYAGI